MNYVHIYFTIYKVARQTKVRASERRSRKKQFCVLFVTRGDQGRMKQRRMYLKKTPHLIPYIR